MQKNSIFILIFFTFLLTNCSSPEGKENDAADQAEHAVETDSPIAETTSVAVGPLPVVNRAHYHTIEIKQMKYWPEVLTVQAGDTVVWVNNGITVHDVTEQPGNAWTSSSMPVGASWQKVVTESADYYCSIHVVMTGKLVVENAQALAK